MNARFIKLEQQLNNCYDRIDKAILIIKFFKKKELNKKLEVLLSKRLWDGRIEHEAEKEIRLIAANLIDNDLNEITTKHEYEAIYDAY